jgi:Xaa-Pro aminopeptidase
MMLTAAGCEGRRRRLLSALDPAPEWIALAHPAHLVYFANFYPTPFSFRSQNASALLLLGADGSSTLFADNLQDTFLQAAHVDDRVTVDWYRGRESAPERNSVLESAALEWFRGRTATPGGVDHAVSMALLSAVAGAVVPDVRNISPVVHQLRRRKDPDEVALMRRSIAAGEAGFEAAIGGITPGMTELQAYGLIQSAAIESAGQPVVVYGDFASGPRTEEKGGPPTARVIESGDLFLLDYSVVVHGYRGDFTNTFVVGDREATPAQRDLEAICLEAMHAGEALLASGAEARGIDAAVRGVFTAHGEEPFPHHSGHGLGLGHPDPPYLTSGSTDYLEDGDIVTLEPGAYRSGIGGMRFERNYVITAAGFELLTHHRLGLHPARQG